jgi:hypothetical protein
VEGWRKSTVLSLAQTLRPTAAATGNSSKQCSVEVAAALGRMHVAAVEKQHGCAAVAITCPMGRNNTWAMYLLSHSRDVRSRPLSPYGSPQRPSHFAACTDLPVLTSVLCLAIYTVTLTQSFDMSVPEGRTFPQTAAGGPDVRCVLVASVRASAAIQHWHLT